MPRVSEPLRAAPRTDGKSAAEPRRSRTRAQVPVRRPGLWRRLRSHSRPVVLLVAVSLAAGSGALAWSTGWAEARSRQAMDGLIGSTIALGFRVEEVLVTGWRQTERGALEAALSVARGDPILTFDPEAARVRLLEIPWIAQARVERRLPDAIHVDLVERQPLALWQRDRMLHLIAGDGTVLTTDRLERWPMLPLVVGSDAPVHARELLAQLDAVPGIAARVAASVRVGDRRWELHLDNGVRVHLPEAGVRRALRRFAALEQQDRLIDRDIVAIDLRLDDRMVIRATSNAIERRRLPEEDT